MRRAGIGLVNDMVLNIGWINSNGERARKVWECKIRENVNQACVACESGKCLGLIIHLLTCCSDQIEVTTSMQSQVVKALSAFRSKLAKAAEPHAKAYLQGYLPSESSNPLLEYSRMQERVAQITNPGEPSTFFMHKQDAETVTYLSHLAASR